VKTEEFSFRFLLSDRDAITGDARSERPAGRIFPDHRRLKGGGKLLGKTDSEQARSSHPGDPGAEKRNVSSIHLRNSPAGFVAACPACLFSSTLTEQRINENANSV